MSDGMGIGVGIGLIPCVGMAFASLLLMKYKINVLLEASLQNFAAGLILAAVASELFPLLAEIPNITGSIGITIGFAIALSLVYGMDALMEKMVGDKDEGSSHAYSVNNDRPPSSPTGRSILPVQVAAQAIADASHRSHIIEHLEEMLQSIAHITRVSDRLLANDNASSNDEHAVEETIDETVHQISYKLDHCRRLLHGSESQQHQSLLEHGRWPQEKKLTVHSNLLNLKTSMVHIMEHLEADAIDENTLLEIDDHIDEMERLIDDFHMVVQSTPSFWQPKPTVVTRQGDTLPFALIGPVCVDALVDGFLIGASYALSTRAGVILAAANTLEMSVLGMTLAASVSKCTGSTVLARKLSLAAPPLIMLLGVVVGIVSGDAARSIEILYAVFISFGVVCLLALVTKELLIEAREAQGSEEKWYVSAMVFAGVFVVLMMDRFIPAR